MNQDAGVFDYDDSTLNSDGNPIDTDVTHSTKGLLLPKQIDVKISIIFKHDYLLGFEGPNRLADADKNKWASNTGKDWPHGTGDRAVAPYMTGDGTIGDSEDESTGTRRCGPEQQAAIAAELERTVYQS